MGFNLIIKPIVFFDLQDAIDWYERESLGLGKRFLSKVEVAKNQIINNPYHYSIFHQDVRRILIEKFPYKIYYIINDTTVIIIGISHGKRSKAFVHRRLKLA